MSYIPIDSVFDVEHFGIHEFLTFFYRFFKILRKFSKKNCKLSIFLANSEIKSRILDFFVNILNLVNIRFFRIFTDFFDNLLIFRKCSNFFVNIRMLLFTVYFMFMDLR